jgi:very-short-patch-repair endonuclease
MRTSLSALAGDGRTPLQRGFGDIAQALGDPGVDPAALKAGWDDVVAEARRVHKLLGDRLRLEEIAASIRVSGAVEWSERLLRSLVDGDTDPLTPPDWRRSWDWARDDAFIRSISDTDRFQVLSEDRASLDDESRRLLASIVRLKTFLELKRRLAPSVEGALAAFAAAVRRLGAGTGASAGRHRKVIRDAALKASAAVPCWIMPEWRVSEQLPPELGAFDLVIVDEASQSDVSALPVILRGKKLLIVGDDKQVSPTMIGVEERTIVQLRHTYLDGLPYADHMDPTTSLYELGGMLFPGKAIMLREHFRCVEPIIRFSSRFYNHDLVPMRLPKQSERLEPPLIDILVRNGRRTGDVNRQEADVIVEEIGKIAADPAFERRSIGVISLLGDKQAKLIGDRLIRELGAEVVERHRILCGSSAVLQGQERDIVFLSMVYCPKTVTMQRSAIYEQRFNVAMSRARDRLVLVRSVTPSDLKPGDLKLQVIEHFRSPMEGGSIQGRRDALALAESPFEKEFGAALLDLGYRIRPQVSVGGFRIDFVVEGEDNRRLAIELDGDRYHGPERWAEDFRRQLALERLGWTFWRCWGSSWVAERDVCIADLRRKLDALGIEPLGAEPVGGDWTEHRQIGESEGAIDGAAGKEPAAPPSGARSGEPASTTEESASPAPAPPTIDPVASAPNPPQEAQVDLFSGSFGGSEPSVSVEPGDLVVVRYEDQPKRPLRVRISTSRNAPTEGLLHVDEPLAKAVLGSMVGDEVEVVIGSGKARYAVIESIEKALAAVA